MGIREKINENPKPYLIGAGVVIVLAVGFVIWNTRGGAGGDGSGVADSGKAYFSEDDGKTPFAAPYEKLGDPNFKGPNDNEAVLAHVFQYPGEQPFIGYLETYTDAGKQKLAQYYRDPANKGTPPPNIQVELERLVKKPLTGPDAWVPASQASEVVTLENKNGVAPAPVMPK